MGSTADKIKGTANEAIGKAKQGIGEATGSDRQSADGHQGRKSRLHEAAFPSVVLASCAAHRAQLEVIKLRRRRPCGLPAQALSYISQLVG